MVCDIIRSFFFKFYAQTRMTCCMWLSIQMKNIVLDFWLVYMSFSRNKVCQKSRFIRAAMLVERYKKDSCYTLFLENAT